jgi:hypothetical protein
MRYNVRITMKDNWLKDVGFSYRTNVSLWTAFRMFVNLYLMKRKNAREHITIELDRNRRKK